MPSVIIERAQQLSGTQSNSLEHLLAEVERQSHDLNTKMLRAEQDEKKFRMLSEEYTSKLSSLKKEANEMKRQVLADAEKIVTESNALVEKTIRELREQQASREVIKRTKETLQQLGKTIEAELKSARTETFPSDAGLKESLNPGDWIAMKSNPSTKGVVVELAGDHVIAVFGSMRMRMERGELMKLEVPTNPPQCYAIIPETTPSGELDLRGMYGDDAVKELDTYLYNAYTAGLKRIDIIHGKGTGALRKRVHAFLQDVSIVDSFRLGEWNEGAAGVTVVFLKD